MKRIPMLRPTKQPYGKLFLSVLLAWFVVTYQMAVTLMDTSDRSHDNEDYFRDDNDDRLHQQGRRGHLDPSKLRQMHEANLQSMRGTYKRRRMSPKHRSHRQKRTADKGIDGPVVPRKPIPEAVPTLCSTYSPSKDTCQIRSCSDSNHTIDPSLGGFQVKHLTHVDGSTTRTTISASKSTASRVQHPRACAISHKYQFVYIHVLKSGGMTMKSFLKNALCGNTELPCANGNHVLKVMPCSSALEEAGANYLVWSFVRNPFSRSYSQYAMAETMKRREQPEGLSFTEFVSSDEYERQRVYKLDVSHYRPQTFFLLDQYGCPVVDFLGRLETMQQDIQTLLELIPSPELKAYVDANNGDLVHQMDTANGFKALQKEDGGQSSLREQFSSSDTVMNVVNEYMSDFDFLGYRKEEVPEK